TFAWPHDVPQWAMAAAALLVLTLGAVLVIDNLRLRREIAQSASARTAVDARMQELQRQIDTDRATSADAAKELARLRAQVAAPVARCGAAVRCESRRPARGNHWS